MAREFVLVDLSSLAYPLWHTSQADPDANKTSQLVVARVRGIAGMRPHVAICCDSGKSFRHELTATYKANRPEHDATLQHQIALCREQLSADGFPVWSVKGFEADDLIATATARALDSDPDATVLIVTGDKDLLQLVGPRVTAMSVRDGSIMDAAGVKAKFSVTPEQVRDYLALVGDTSDNVKGAPGIGPKKAAELLNQYGSLSAIYEALKTSPSSFKPSIATALHAFRLDMDMSLRLISLRTDAELPFEEITADRVANEMASTCASFAVEDEAEMDAEGNDAPLPFPSAAQPAATEIHSDGPAPSASTALARRESTDISAPVEWGLQPQTMRDARVLAKDMFESRMFSAYGTPHGVLSTIMVGRELGLPAMASLRMIHNIEGKHALSASLMAAVIIKSGFAEYFRPAEISETSVTYETLRRGPGNKPFTLTHTIEMAKKAWPKTKADWEKSFEASGWGRNPTDMLVARAQSRLARLIYPDVTGGLYTPEELAEVRESVAA